VLADLRVLSIVQTMHEGKYNPEQEPDDYFRSELFNDVDELTIGLLLEKAVATRDSGFYVATERLLAGAIWLASRKLGAHHLGTINARYLHSEAIFLMGQPNEALAEVRALKNDLAPLDMPNTLANAELLEASALERLGHYEEALGIIDGVDPQGDLALAESRMRQRVSVLKWLRRFDEALQALEGKGTDIAQADPSDTELATAFLRADILNSAGRPQEALPIIERVMQLRHNRLGWKHVRTLEARFIHLDVRFKLGDASAGLKAANELVDQMTEVLGPLHPHTLAAEHLRGQYLLQSGDPNASLAHTEENWTRKSERLGAMHPDTLSSRFLQADAHYGRGDYARAQELIEPLIADRTMHTGPRHRDTLMARLLKVFILEKLNAQDSACEEARALRPLMVEILGPQANETQAFEHFLRTRLPTCELP
jgi:tetratricopeptide (TPR) repeat protein